MSDEEKGNAEASTLAVPTITDGRRLSTSSAKSIASVDKLVDDLFVAGQPDSTPKERMAWYMYDWANSVYNQVAIGAFLPLLISGMAQGYLEEQGIDPETGCAGYFSSSIFGDESAKGGSCVSPTAVATGYISLSSFIQMFLFIWAAPLADYGNRKGYLVLCAILGAVLTASTSLISTNSAYPVVGWLVVASNTVFGLSVVLYNSFLPPIVANDPRVKKEPDHQKKLAIAEAITNSMSGRGFAAGYAGGTLLLALSIVAVLLELGDTTLGVYRTMMAATGIWWLGFGSYTFVHLTNRPLPPLPTGTNILTFGFGKFWHNFRAMLSKIPMTGIFLLSWFLSSDGVFVISSIGGLFASDELNLDVIVVIGILVLTPLSALGGNILWLWVYNKYNWTSKKGISVMLYLYLAIPAYMFVSYIPGMPFGLKAPASGESGSTLAAIEMLALGAYYGQLLGAFQAFSRALFAELIPPGLESEYFGLFEVTDKGSSWIAPLYVGYLGSQFGTLRAGFPVVVVEILLGLLLLNKVDVERGREEARAYGADIMKNPKE